MCNILVYIKEDNSHPDPEIDWKKYKAGDVIDIQAADDFFWGKDIQGENALGWWAVVVVPNTQASEYNYLLEPEQFEIESLQFDKSEIKHQIRAHCLDVTKLKPLMSAEEFESIIFKKPSLFDSNTIG